ncbi:kinesin family protein-like protein [Anopheles sinensis]|uniref:Kinesin family protein-like protein n=1 Tax=Anopheles sinensis TaxID=74873 RepID=A0A084WU23_ANOSI|nr:kinesin family protein-like protein [Anopheles sinensis]
MPYPAAAVALSPNPSVVMANGSPAPTVGVLDDMAAAAATAAAAAAMTEALVVVVPPVEAEEAHEEEDEEGYDWGAARDGW